MIDWLTVVQVVLAAVGAIIAVAAAARSKPPTDLTVLPAAVSALLLIVQVFVSIASPMWGDSPVSDPLEFWMYLITDVMMVPGIVIFALVEKSKWGNFGIALVGFANAVMLYRMHVLWNGY